MGVCATPPEACPAVFDPVCSCDGVTYGNACEAAMVSMSIDHPGECMYHASHAFTWPTYSHNVVEMLTLD